MPRLTIVTQWYPPEQAPFGRMMHELAAWLVSCGWEVSVITGFPNHPSGVVMDGYSKRWLQEEVIDGVRVRRVWLATSSRRSVFSRVLTFLSFTLSGSWRLLRSPRPDVVFAVLQPLSVGVILPLIARLKRTRLIFNLQDLHPDAQIRLGMVRNPWLIRSLRWMEAHAYRSSAAVTVICQRFREHVVARGTTAERAFVIANWVDVERIRPVPEAGLAFRRGIGIDDQAFVVLWAGTLGHVSGAAILLDAARLLREYPRIRFLVVGEGPLRAALVERAEREGLTNVIFKPFQPEESLLAVQNCADVSLVTLEAQLAELSVPSKVLAYLAAGRPVIASVPVQSETAALIRDAGAGVVVPAGDPHALADALCQLMDDPQTVCRLGEAARRFAVAELSAVVAMKRYERVFRTVCGLP
jgi:colanic acid biosynthesis glycosyl transferase WcaI